MGNRNLVVLQREYVRSASQRPGRRVDLYYMNSQCMENSMNWGQSHYSPLMRNDTLRQIYRVLSLLPLHFGHARYSQKKNKKIFCAQNRRKIMLFVCEARILWWISHVARISFFILTLIRINENVMRSTHREGTENERCQWVQFRTVFFFLFFRFMRPQ